jgi:hypothetical protein
MGQREKRFRECEECGEPIVSGNPNARLCKRCAGKNQNKRNRDEARRRPKDQRKKKRKKSPEDDFYQEELEY